MLSQEVGAFNEDALRKYQTDPENIFHFGMAKGEGGLHPTQKPLKLMKALIELTTCKEQIVLDPFCGSGTTLLAAQLTERHFIGIEREEKYVMTARERLSKNDLFTLFANAV